MLSLQKASLAAMGKDVINLLIYASFLSLPALVTSLFCTGTSVLMVKLWTPPASLIWASLQALWQLCHCTEEMVENWSLQRTWNLQKALKRASHKTGMRGHWPWISVLFLTNLIPSLSRLLSLQSWGMCSPCPCLRHSRGTSKPRREDEHKGTAEWAGDIYRWWLHSSAFPRSLICCGCLLQTDFMGNKTPPVLKRIGVGLLSLLTVAQCGCMHYKAWGGPVAARSLECFKPILILEARCWEATGSSFLQHKHCLASSSVG